MVIERIVLVSIGVCFVLCVTLFIFFIVFYNKKFARMEDNFENVLSIARQQLQQQTLNNLSYDIIENFGNNLFAIKVTLIYGVLHPLQKLAEGTHAALSNPDPKEFRNLLLNFGQSVSQIQQSVLDAKYPVEAMSTDMIDTAKRLRNNFVDNSLMKNLENELNRLTNYTLHKEIRGKEYPLEHEKEIILLWICQEVLNNVIQHSEAKKLNIAIQYEQSSFFLNIRDEGIGFDQKDLPKLKKSGKGLQNMFTAARMIDAKLIVQSQPNQGTSVAIHLDTLSN